MHRFYYVIIIFSYKTDLHLFFPISLSNVWFFIQFSNTLFLHMENHFLLSSIYRVRHIKCYRAIALKLLIISKNVSEKSFRVREGRHTGPTYFYIDGGAEATSRSTPIFKILRQFSDLQNKVILVIEKIIHGSI